jgi:hypothetical protein
VPAYSAKASEDEQLAWNFFVRHYADETRQARDYKTTYDTKGGGQYTGLHPPAGSKMKVGWMISGEGACPSLTPRQGTLYPRTNTLGGCTGHNALIAIYPHQSDFEYLATLTGDQVTCFPPIAHCQQRVLTWFAVLVACQHAEVLLPFRKQQLPPPCNPRTWL